MYIALSLLVSLAGLVIYGLTKEKLQEVGRIMFAMGLLAFLLRFTGLMIGG